MSSALLEENLAREKIDELFGLFAQSFKEQNAEVPDYIDFLKAGPQSVVCAPIGLEDGIINFLYRLSEVGAGQRSVVVKWARLVPRIAEVHDVGIPEDSYEEGLQRNIIECRGLRTIERYVSDSTPRIYWSDEKRFFFIMEDLSAWTPMKQLLDRGLVIPEAFRNITRFMSALHKATHVSKLAEREFNTLIKEFDQELYKVGVKWMYEESFSSTQANAKVRRRTPELEPILPQIIDNDDIRAVNKLLYHSFLNVKTCFVHGDSHPGFAMIHNDHHGIKVIDTEFANIGNPVNELGYFLGEVIIWYHVNQGRNKGDVCRQIRECAREMIGDYVDQMESYLPDDKEFMHYVAANAGHFNAFRTVNLMPYAPFDDLPISEARCVATAIRLMKGMNSIDTIEDFIKTAFDSS